MTTLAAKPEHKYARRPSSDQQRQQTSSPGTFASRTDNLPVITTAYGDLLAPRDILRDTREPDPDTIIAQPYQELSSVFITSVTVCSKRGKNLGLMRARACKGLFAINSHLTLCKRSENVNSRIAQAGKTRDNLLFCKHLLHLLMAFSQPRVLNLVGDPTTTGRPTDCPCLQRPQVGLPAQPSVIPPSRADAPPDDPPVWQTEKLKALQHNLDTFSDCPTISARATLHPSWER